MRQYHDDILDMIVVNDYRLHMLTNDRKEYKLIFFFLPSREYKDEMVRSLLSDFVKHCLRKPMVDCLFLDQQLMILLCVLHF